MRPGHAPPIPIITAAYGLYQRILMADHVIIVAEEAAAPAGGPFFTTRQCMLSRLQGEGERELLLRMVGG